MKCALSVAERKFEESETKREAEREAHYRLVLNMLDRWHTAEKKTYAVSTDVLPAKPPEPEKPRPLTSDEEAEREFYAQDAVAANKSADEGRALWDEMHAQGLSAITMDGEIG